jgi:hypothetical protein
MQCGLVVDCGHFRTAHVVQLPKIKQSKVVSKRRQPTTGLRRVTYQKSEGTYKSCECFSGVPCGPAQIWAKVIVTWTQDLHKFLAGMGPENVDIKLSLEIHVCLITFRYLSGMLCQHFWLVSCLWMLFKQHFLVYDMKKLKPVSFIFTHPVPDSQNSHSFLVMWTYLLLHSVFFHLWPPVGNLKISAHLACFNERTNDNECFYTS